jgi:hypothetical protein
VHPRKRDAIVSIDWLGLWGLSVGICALVLAGVAYFTARDNVGAACILFGAASIMALIVYAGAEPDARN